MANTVWQYNVGPFQNAAPGDWTTNIGPYPEPTPPGDFDEGVLSVSADAGAVILGEFFSPIDEGVLSVSGAASAAILEEVFIAYYSEGTLSVSAAAAAAIIGEVYQVLSTFPEGRPSDYDPDSVWDEDTGTWISTYVSPTRSNVTFLVAVGEQGDIYFYEDL